MDCKEALPMMHEYLDGDLTGAPTAELKRHLLACRDCSRLFRQFETTEAMIKAAPAPKAPDDLKQRILQALPPERGQRLFGEWFRRHPAVSVAAVFVLVMMGSFMSLWNEDHQLMVQGNDLEQIVIKGDTVLVPAGHKVAGDLTVKSGKLQVDGEINGNLTVIDGSVNLASTAHISGQVTRIDQALEWVWFKVSGIFTQLSK